MSKKIITSSGGEIALVGNNTQKKAPKIAGVHPFGSKILVEVLTAEETMHTNLFISENTTDDGAPQAYIIELGPGVAADSGLKAGQRVYWNGKGTAVSDPRSEKIRALLEVHNIQAIIEEEKACCGGGDCN
jgi:co-chaperonin GroES (HSP10)